MQYCKQVKAIADYNGCIVPVIVIERIVLSLIETSVAVNCENSKLKI